MNRTPDEGHNLAQREAIARVLRYIGKISEVQISTEARRAILAHPEKEFLAHAAGSRRLRPHEKV